ncbi:MAG TPA: nucleotidyltransferase domain-containing protein [Spirochaetia bacterium]|nr:nucleotidyltransferase domain-containing protein [Spirochaetia bacterium]
MSLSKRYLDRNPNPIDFDPDALARRFEEELPEIMFAYLLGSAAGQNRVPPHSDLDLAVCLSGDSSFELYSTVQDICTAVVGDVRCDMGILNNAEAVYRFEALKGRLLFTRDREAWLTFYSRASREYEHQMFDYEKQRRYRLEARA